MYFLLDCMMSFRNKWLSKLMFSGFFLSPLLFLSCKNLLETYILPCTVILVTLIALRCRNCSHWQSVRRGLGMTCSNTRIRTVFYYLHVGLLAFVLIFSWTVSLIISWTICAYYFVNCMFALVISWNACLRLLFRELFSLIISWNKCLCLLFREQFVLISWTVFAYYFVKCMFVLIISWTVCAYYFVNCLRLLFREMNVCAYYFVKCMFALIISWNECLRLLFREMHVCTYYFVNCLRLLFCILRLVWE